MNIVFISKVRVETTSDTFFKAKMRNRSNSSGMPTVILYLLWMVGLVTPSSMHVMAQNNSHSHDQGLRDVMANASSLGKSDNHMLNELKDIVFFLSQKIDYYDVRIQSLEDKVRAQDTTIKALKSEVGDATSFLQSDDRDCLPKFRDTDFGPRCDFRYVTRFQNRTFFNDDVVFNENVEFDSDANCMPTYNSTTQMCSMNNNFTFDDGDITFDNDVLFDDDVRFNDDVRFKKTVKMDNNVEFNNAGEVTFKKKVKFQENVLIKNEDHDIELRLEDKVTARFYQDTVFKVDTHTTFYQDVDMQKDLHVDGDLKVEKMTELDDLEIYGYLWVDGETWLDGELNANHHAVIKNGLKVKTGGLDVSQNGAKISGTTDVYGTFNLNGQGNAKRNFDIDGKLTATSAVIDNQSAHRKLQEAVAFHQLPVTSPALTVIGDTDIEGKLHADQIRSDDINNPVDIDEVLDQIKIELQNENLLVGDVIITKNLNTAESVLTESRLLQLLNGLDLNVDSITANSATIGGQSVPVSSDPISSAEIVRLLNGQDLRLNILRSNAAIIGDREYPHSDPKGTVTPEEVVHMLEGKKLSLEYVSTSSFSTKSATIGGVTYPHQPNNVDIDQVVDGLMNYDGEVTIPRLASNEVEITASVQRNSNGQIIETPGSLLIEGEDVAFAKDIIRLDNRINIISMPPKPNPGVTRSQIVSALEGASLSVSSLDAKSLTKSQVEVTTMDDVGDMIGDAQLVADNAEVACTCSANDVEAVVTTDFVRGKVDESYVSSLGFMKESVLSTYDFSSYCTCSASDVQNNINQDFLRDLGVSFGCSCSEDFVTEVISSKYIQGVVDELGVEAACTCSAADIESVVTSDYIADKGFKNDYPDCSCSIEESQITDVVDSGYIADLGFLTTCPCGVVTVTGDE